MTPPQVQDEAQTWSKAEVAAIAKRQRRVLVAIVVALLAAGLSMYVPYASFIASLLVAVMVYDLARFLRCSAVPLAVCALVPLLNLLVLLSVSSSATSVLKRHGIRVGLMGASKHDLERFQTNG